MDQEKRRGRRPIETLTDVQRRTLVEIRAFIARHKYPPTVQELAELLSIASASAHAQINHLVRKGYIKREAKKARGLSILRDVDEKPTDLVSVPIYGVVAAGQPVLTEQNHLGDVLVEERLCRTGQCFALRVSGESMINADIVDGDVLIVRKQPIAENGDIVVAQVNNDTTVKRLVIRSDSIELRPENPKASLITIGPEDDVRILGKVVGIRRETAT